MKLSTRMKNYEIISKNFLMKRQPAIIRLDGKAFHTFTRGMKTPFDNILLTSMEQTMLYLCKNIQGCVLGYTQSDEITLVLVDYQIIESQAWFDYNISKMCSVSASMATLIFNKTFREYTNLFKSNNIEDYTEYLETLKSKFDSAMFDSRAFTLPKEEVVNCLIWRQQDATRNSIQSVGQKYFSHKALNKKKVNEIQNMLLTEKNINWNNYKTRYKRGCCAIKKECKINISQSNETIRNKWVIDNEIPIFSKNKNYIDKLIKF